jgi:hypothetical protein
MTVPARMLRLGGKFSNRRPMAETPTAETTKAMPKT